MVPDSMLAPQNPEAPGPVTFERNQSTVNPEIQRLARQMQEAGDALCTQYKGKFEVCQYPSPATVVYYL